MAAPASWVWFANMASLRHTIDLSMLPVSTQKTWHDVSRKVRCNRTSVPGFSYCSLSHALLSPDEGFLRPGTILWWYFHAIRSFHSSSNEPKSEQMRVYSSLDVWSCRFYPLFTFWHFNLLVQELAADLKKCFIEMICTIHDFLDTHVLGQI